MLACLYHRSRITHDKLNEVIETSPVEFNTVSREEMRELFPEYESDARQFDDSDYYAVDFERATRQLSRRKVFLRDGKAYIAKDDLCGFFVSEFEDRLREGIEEYAEIQHQFRDPRIEEILKQLPVVVGE